MFLLGPTSSYHTFLIQSFDAACIEYRLIVRSFDIGCICLPLYGWNGIQQLLIFQLRFNWRVMVRKSLIISQCSVCYQIRDLPTGLDPVLIFNHLRFKWYPTSQLYFPLLSFHFSVLRRNISSSDYSDHQFITCHNSYHLSLDPFVNSYGIKDACI